MADLIHKTSCRVCKKNDLENILNPGSLLLANASLEKGELNNKEAKFIFIDDRPGSQTYKQQDMVVISEKCPKIIIVPMEIFHGWMSLEDNTLMISTASELYNREKPDEIRISPDSFGDVWAVKGK